VVVLVKPKFGVFLPFYSFQNKNTDPYYNQLKQIALECEQLGYDSIWLDDHLMYDNSQILECWTALSALAASTQRIRLGSMVMCNAHRNPALTAKAAATIDVISEGRLEFGIGTGANQFEHEAYGFDFLKPGDRTEQLDEALEIITRLWTQDKTSYSGKHYSIKDAVCEPKPKQKPHPPIIVGGAGEKYTLKTTAKYADRFDFGYLSSIEKYKHKLKVLENHCKDVGRAFSEIERSCWPSGQIIITKNKEALAEKITEFKPTSCSLEGFMKYTLAGTIDDCVKALRVYNDLGVTYFMLYFGDLPSTDSLDLFSQVKDKLA
jgi:F420-dependent oxidoreductase-like protein